MDNHLIPTAFQWFAQHPFGVATMVYVASVCGVLVHAYFETRERI